MYVVKVEKYMTLKDEIEKVLLEHNKGNDALFAAAEKLTQAYQNDLIEESKGYFDKETVRQFDMDECECLIVYFHKRNET